MDNILIFKSKRPLIWKICTPQMS
ncbi:hypothetical protein LINPERPRIM_LOCUS5339 [Linum perenne]